MSGTRVTEVSDGLLAVRSRIEAARLAAGRRDDVGLVVVTKTFPATDVVILASLHAADVAENRDQEARRKRAEVATLVSADGIPRWHMIGQLQRNKVNSVARWADVVESVDQPDLVAALGRATAGSGRRLEVLIQVALDPTPRPERGGVHPSGALALAAAVVAEPALWLRGVMGVAPFPGDPDDAFGRLALVAEEVRSRWPDADRISAGMSDDLEHAVVHGATQVRVGGAILGPRPTVQ